MRPSQQSDSNHNILPAFGSEARGQGSINTFQVCIYSSTTATTVTASINNGFQTLRYIQVTLGPSSSSSFEGKANTFRTNSCQSSQWGTQIA